MMASAPHPPISCAVTPVRLYCSGSGDLIFLQRGMNCPTRTPRAPYLMLQAPPGVTTTLVVALIIALLRRLHFVLHGPERQEPLRTFEVELLHHLHNHGLQVDLADEELDVLIDLVDAPSPGQLLQQYLDLFPRRSLEEEGRQAGEAAAAVAAAAPVLT